MSDPAPDFDPLGPDPVEATAPASYHVELEIRKFGSAARGTAVVTDGSGDIVHTDYGNWLAEKDRARFCREAALELAPDVEPPAGATQEAAAARAADVEGRRATTRAALGVTLLAQLAQLRRAREAGRSAAEGRRAEKRRKVEAGGWRPTRLSQQANALQVVRELGGNARFNTATGGWMVYRASEGRFVPDDKRVVDRVAKRVAAKTWAFVEDPPEGFDHKAAFKHAVDSERASGVAAAMRLAQSERGVPVTPAEFDVDPFLLNVLNGAVDLRTGELLPHAPDRLVTKLAPVAFDPGAACPLWESFLWRIMDGSDEMIGYLQRLAGLCLTGDATVQELFIPYGGGANGKSVFFDTLSALLGDYAGMAPESLLTVRAFGSEHPTEVAGLCGRRMVVASETEEGAKLRVQQVKRLTGDAKITGRFMRQDYFEFDRTHKLVLITNNKPVISEATNAVWRRVRLIPFDVTIPKEERDPNLMARLAAERPGILNWMVRGCLAWRDGGMRTPGAVMVATEEYREEQDGFGEFVADNLVVGPGKSVARADLWKAYDAATQGVQDKLKPAGLYERVRRIEGVEDRPVRIGAKTVRCFLGIGVASLGDRYGAAQRHAGAY